MNKRALSSVLAASVLMSQLPMGILAAQASKALEDGLNAYNQNEELIGAYDTVYDALMDASATHITIGSDVYGLGSDAVIRQNQTVYVAGTGTVNVYANQKDASSYPLLTSSQGNLNVYVGATLQDNGNNWIGAKGDMTVEKGHVNFKFNGNNNVAMTVNGQATANGFTDTLLGNPMTMTIGESGKLTMPANATMDIYGNFKTEVGQLAMGTLSDLKIKGSGAAWLAEDANNIKGQITVWSQDGSFKYGNTLIFGTDKWTQAYAASESLFALNEGTASFAPFTGTLTVNGTVSVNDGAALKNTGIDNIVIAKDATLEIPQNVTFDLGTATVTVNGTLNNNGTVKGEEGSKIEVGEGGSMIGEGDITGPVEKPDPKPEPGVYTITFNANGGQFSGAYVLETDANGTLTGQKIPGVDRDGYKFAGWFTEATGGEKYGEGNRAPVETYVFTADTDVYAQWTKNSSGGGGGGSSSTTYAVNIGTFENGSVKANPSRAAKGAVVSLTVTPDKGYELDTLTVTDKDGDTVRLSTSGNNVYTFTMPASQVTVKATFKEASTLPFSDVSTSDWFYPYVKYVYENGLMSGVSDTSFAPNATTTRGMIVTTLYSMAGKPTAADQGFNDVAAGQWYTDAVNWAAANKIVTGYPNGGFGPNDTITREQLAVMLYGYAQYKGYDVSASKDLSGYADASQVSSYAMPAMQWAFANGLISGTSNTTLSPAGAATRAQVATILTAFSQNIVK